VRTARPVRTGDGAIDVDGDQNGPVKLTASVVKRAIASLIIASGIVLVVGGLNSSVTGKAAQKLPAQIENITPVRSASQVQSQENIVCDLITGYTGELTVDGVLLKTVSLDTINSGAVPGQEISLPQETIFEPGNNTLTYTPSKGAPVPAFVTGVNTVTVRYWKIIDGPNFSQTFTWQFTVV
jgi:hypothetical protein